MTLYHINRKASGVKEKWPIGCTGSGNSLRRHSATLEDEENYSLYTSNSRKKKKSNSEKKAFTNGEKPVSKELRTYVQQGRDLIDPLSHVGQQLTDLADTLTCHSKERAHTHAHV